MSTGKHSRAEYLREYQRKRRKAKALRRVEIELSDAEFALFDRLMKQQRGPLEGGAKRLLMLGAKFAANAGTPRGRKYKTPQA